MPESEYERAARTRLAPLMTQPVTQPGKNEAESNTKKNADESQVSASQELSETAGERIRTADVQLGKLAFYH